NTGTDPDRYVVDGSVIKDTQPVIPGQPHQVSISYRLRYVDNITLNQAFSYGADDVQVLVPADNDKISLTGNGFSAGEPYSFGADLSEKFVRYTHPAVMAGTSLTFEVKGEPPRLELPPELQPKPSPLPYVLAAGGVILVLVAIGFLLVGR